MLSLSSKISKWVYNQFIANQSKAGTFTSERKDGEVKHTQGYRYFMVCLAVLAVPVLAETAQSWSSLWILLSVILIAMYVMEKYDPKGERKMAVDRVVYCVVFLSTLAQALPLIWYVWGKNRRTMRYQGWRELPKWRLKLMKPAVFFTVLGFAVGGVLILVLLFIFEGVKKFSRWFFMAELPPEGERGECTSCLALSNATPLLGCSSLGECPYRN